MKRNTVRSVVRNWKNQITATTADGQIMMDRGFLLKKCFEKYLS